MAISIAKLAIHLTTETGGMIQGFGKAKSMVNGFSRSMGGGGMGGMSIGAAGAAAAVATAAAAIAAFSKVGLSLASTYEDAAAKLNTFTGSAGGAKAMVADLAAFQAGSTFEFAETLSSATELLSQGMGTDTVTPMLQALGEVASGTGQSLNEITHAYTRIQAEGTLTEHGIKSLGTAGQSVLKVLAAKYKTTTDDVREMAKAGQIGASEVTQALATLSTTGGQFAGTMARQAETFSGQWSSLKVNIAALSQDMMQYLLPTITAVLRGFNQLIDTIRGVKAVTQEDRDAAIKAATEKEAAVQKMAEAQRKAADDAKAVAEQQKKLMDDLRQKGESLTKSLRTPAEVWKDSVNEMNQLLSAGVIEWETYTRGIEQATQALEKTAKTSKLASPDRPIGGVVQGTAAARSAEFAATSEMNKIAEQSRQQTELAKQAKAQREAMLSAIKAGKPIDIREVTL